MYAVMFNYYPLSGYCFRTLWFHNFSVSSTKVSATCVSGTIGGRRCTSCFWLYHEPMATENLHNSQMRQSSGPWNKRLQADWSLAPNDLQVESFRGFSPAFIPWPMGKRLLGFGKSHNSQYSLSPHILMPMWYNRLASVPVQGMGLLLVRGIWTPAVKLVDSSSQRTCLLSQFIMRTGWSKKIQIQETRTLI